MVNHFTVFPLPGTRVPYKPGVGHCNCSQGGPCGGTVPEPRIGGLRGSQLEWLVRHRALSHRWGRSGRCSWGLFHADLVGLLLVGRDAVKRSAHNRRSACVESREVPRTFYIQSGLVCVFCRHVTVCFLHLAILWSLRHYLSLNAHGVHTFSLCVVDFTTDYARFFWVVLLTPIIGGVVHSLFFDDEKLYKFGDSSVGSKSQLAFGAFSAIATFYYLNVPLRAVELEQVHLPPCHTQDDESVCFFQNKPETVAKAILRVVVKDSPNGFSPNTSEPRK